jgi:ABC-2 type transport system ATP-binding protein
MRELGSKRMVLELQEPLANIPLALSAYDLELTRNGLELTYTYDSQAEHTGITALLGDLRRSGIRFHDVKTSQSSLEDIFVELLKKIR